VKARLFCCVFCLKKNKNFFSMGCVCYRYKNCYVCEKKVVLFVEANLVDWHFDEHKKHNNKMSVVQSQRQLGNEFNQRLMTALGATSSDSSSDDEPSLLLATLEYLDMSSILAVNLTCKGTSWLPAQLSNSNTVWHKFITRIQLHYHDDFTPLVVPGLQTSATEQTNVNYKQAFIAARKDHAKMNWPFFSNYEQIESAFAKCGKATIMNLHPYRTSKSVKISTY